MTEKVEWIIVADRVAGESVVRSGYKTAGEAAAARSEIERNMREDDETNYCIRSRPVQR